MVTVSRIVAGDQPDWRDLYRGYAAFQNASLSDDALDRLWQEIIDDTQPMLGAIARLDGVAVGLVHFQPFYRPLQACWNGFVNDIYVSDAARGSGAADALMKAVRDHARSAGWGEVRWATGADNARAMAFYDRVSQRTPLVTYKMPITPDED
ncbi:N-acetyltransferase family protein [Tepidamorphus sp. 3E244]|uniref:GNAT family N-acetyltransferase n=1 Tax=Tepidamorphus sp. 3E244 TaxID=3385498 RepID=UPI0038FC8462